MIDTFLFTINQSRAAMLPDLLKPSDLSRSALVVNMGHWLAAANLPIESADLASISAAVKEELPSDAQLVWSSTTFCPIAPTQIETDSQFSCDLKDSLCRWRHHRKRHGFCVDRKEGERFSVREEIRMAREDDFRVFDAYAHTRQLGDEDFMDGLHLNLARVSDLNTRLLSFIARQ